MDKLDLLIWSLLIGMHMLLHFVHPLICAADISGQVIVYVCLEEFEEVDETPEGTLGLFRFI